DIMIAQMSRKGDVSDAQIMNIRRLFGDPGASMWEQYGDYMRQIFSGDLGISSQFFPEKVSDLIMSALPWSIGLIGTATVLAFVLGIALGAFSGWKRGTWVDQLVPFTTLLQSLPYFWVALALLYVLAVQNPAFPIVGGYDFFRFDGVQWSWEF